MKLVPWLKAEDYSKTYKRQISMLRLIALRGVRVHKNVEQSQAGKTLYIGIESVNNVVELLLQLENKQIMQITWRFNKITCIRFIFVVCVMSPSQWHALPAS